MYVGLYFKFLLFSTPVDEDTNEAWENSCSSYDHYEEVKENIYGKELEELPLNSGQVRLNNRLCQVNPSSPSIHVLILETDLHTLT